MNRKESKLTPWWLRPTREGAAEEPEEDAPQPARTEPESQPEPETEAAAEPAPPRRGERGREAAAAGASAPSGGDGAAAPRPRSRRGRSAKSRAAAEEAPEKAAAPEPKPTRQRRRELSAEDVAVEDADNAIREFISVAGERSAAVSAERKIALFCDLENVALGVRDSTDVKKFDIHLVLERLLEKGRIIVKKAYCDWERYSEFKRAFHEAAVELIDIPQKYYSGKNSADIKMVTDAMDLCFSKEHLDTFVILSGDSDFSPLVSKLKENNKYVIGVGVKNSTSSLLVDNCDEFIYYEDLWREREKAPRLGTLPKKKAEVFGLMIDAIKALIRDNKDILWGSMVKQTMQRKRPSFNEGYYGYGTLSELLEDAERNGIIKLKKDKRSGSYVITGFGGPKSV